jgi:hypothetical protein
VVAVSVVTFRRGEDSSFIGSGVVKPAMWGVETKSQGIEVEIEPSPNSRSTEKMLLKHVVIPHRILMFWPHWHTIRGVACLSSWGYGLRTSSLM